MLKNIRGLLSQLSLFCRIEAAMADELEAHDSRLYSLQETVKMLEATIKRMDGEIRQLKLAVGKQVTPRV